eukprot:1249231-Pleurochrysis_carterae.AAC.1
MYRVYSSAARANVPRHPRLPSLLVVAQCAALSKAGLVYATGTEDMDALTFATPVLVRADDM